MSTPDQLSDIHKKQMGIVMYFMGKSVARDSFSDFLESCGVSEEDWPIIKKHIEKTLDVKLYV